MLGGCEGFMDSDYLGKGVWGSDYVALSHVWLREIHWRLQLWNAKKILTEAEHLT